MILFAGLFGGGHVVLVSVIAILIVLTLHNGHHNLLLSTILYFAICLILWIISDWIFGPAHIPMSPYDFPHY